MRLYLVRHGETELNKEFRFIGRTDVGLSDTGRLQAKAVAERLAGEDIIAVYSSDLLRAQQTAHAIAEPLGLDVVVVPELREIDFGHWEGLRYEEIVARDYEHFHVWREDPISIAIPGGETWQHFEERVLGAIDRIIEENEDGGVVVVSHGGPIRLIMTYLNNGDRGYFNSFWPRPGTISTIEITDGVIEVISENEPAYVEQEQDDV